MDGLVSSASMKCLIRNNLSDFFTGKYENSFARGELYNADPASGDARQCGTTASLCGIEKAAYEKDEEATKRAIRYDLTLHAYMLTQSGIPGYLQRR